MSSSDDKTLKDKASALVKNFISDIDAKEITIFLIFGLIIFMIFKMMFGGIFGISLVVIENGPCPNSSMCPTYDKGDMFIINKVAPDKIEIGDVIVYEKDILIIHRVINITISGDEYYYRVSGDNIGNNRIDTYEGSTTIPYDAVLGKTVLVIRRLGYLRLWLAENQVMRIIIIVVIVGLGAYLILAPDKKSDEEKAKEKQDKAAEEQKEKKELKTRIKEYFVNSWNNSKKWFIELFTVKKQRIKLIIFCSAIILLVILIPVIDQAIKVEGATTGIHDISGLNLDLSHSTEDITFLSFNIHYSHDGSWNQVLKYFLVEGIQNGTVLSIFVWKALYQVETDGLIGGSLVFDAAEFNDSLELALKITYTIKNRFGADQVGLVYQETFTDEDWNPPT